MYVWSSIAKNTWRDKVKNSEKGEFYQNFLPKNRSIFFTFYISDKASIINNFFFSVTIESWKLN